MKNMFNQVSYGKTTKNHMIPLPTECSDIMPEFRPDENGKCTNGVNTCNKCMAGYRRRIRAEREKAERL